MPRHRWVSILFPISGRAARVLICLAILACAILQAGENALAAEAPPLTRDLRADARLAAASHQPLLLFFSLEGCPYCARVRREYLGPMSGNAEDAKRVLIRELPIEATLPGFDGKPRPAREIADAYRVTLFPTVVLVDAEGRALADPLVGFSSPDFYGATLDSRIDTARDKIKQN